MNGEIKGSIRKYIFRNAIIDIFLFGKKCFSSYKNWSGDLWMPSHRKKDSFFIKVPFDFRNTQTFILMRSSTWNREKDKSVYTKFVLLHFLQVSDWLFVCVCVVACRELRCLRNTIHSHLMVTYVLADALWVLSVISTDQVNGFFKHCFCVYTAIILYISNVFIAYYFLRLLKINKRQIPENIWFTGTHASKKCWALSPVDWRIKTVRMNNGTRDSGRLLRGKREIDGT